MGHNRDGWGPGGMQRMEWLILIEEIFVTSKDKFSCAAGINTPQISIWYIEYIWLNKKSLFLPMQIFL